MGKWKGKHNGPLEQLGSHITHALKHMPGSAISQKRRCREHPGADNARSCCSSLGFGVQREGLER